MHWSRLLVIHPARGTDFWYLVGTLFLVGYFAARVERHNWLARPTDIICLVVAGLMMPLFAFSRVSIPAGVAALLLLNLGLWRFLLQPFRLQLVSLLVLLAAAWTAHAHLGKYELPSRFFHPYTTQATPGELELARWAASQTPTEALFVVPVEMDLFRPLAQRGVLSTWKDGSAILWDRPFVEEWVRRMHALGKPVIREHAARWPIAPTLYPKGWDDAQFRQLSHDFGATHCVLPTDHPTALPVVFAGRQGYKIIRVSYGR